MKTTKEEIKEILKGIDEQNSDSNDGWWETSVGEEFGRGIMEKVTECVDLLQAQNEVMRKALEYYLKEDNGSIALEAIKKIKEVK